MIREKDLVKLKCSGDKLAKVVKVNEHTLTVKIFNKRANKFHPYAETVAVTAVEPANLTPLELSKMPCGKVVLTKNTALMLLATNEQFKQVKRREKRVYYCTRCEGYHTTSQPWMPIAIKQQMELHPISQEALIVKGGIICQKTIFKWLRDVLGLRISQNWFKDSLKEYASSMREALEQIIQCPEDYIEFFFEKRFVSNHALEIN